MNISIRLRSAATRENLYIILSACAVAVLWSMIEVIGAWLPDHPSPYQVVWVRYGTHLFVMLVVLGPRYGTALFKTSHLHLQIGRGLLMLGMPICFILGTRFMTLDDIWAIFWFVLLLGSMLLAMLVLYERPAWPVWLAATLAVVGVVLMLNPDLNWLRPAMLWPIGMGACFGLYLISLRLSHNESVLPTLFYTAVAVFVPLSFGLPFYWRPLTWANAAGMALIGLLGLLLLYALDKALARGSIGLVAPYLLSVPLWMLGLDVLRAHTTMSISTLFGSFLLVGALIGLVIYHLHGRAPQDADVQSIDTDLQVS